MTQRPALLIMQRHLAPLTAFLESQYDVYRFWEGPPVEAALDVFEAEPTDAARWAGVPNTVLTPHTGGATTEAVQGMLMLLMQNLQAAFAGEPLKTPVPEA